MARQFDTNLDMANNKVINLAAPVNPNDAARIADVNIAVEGISWKRDVRVAPPGNVTLSAPGTTLDGVTMAIGDRFLAFNQTTGTENGLYNYQGAAAAATRTIDSLTGADLNQAVVAVAEGTNLGASFRQSVANLVIGTGTPTFLSFGATIPPASTTVAGSVKIATQALTDAGTDTQTAVTPADLTNWAHKTLVAQGTVGDGAALNYTVNHGFGTKNVMVEVYRTATPFDTVIVDVARPDTNNVTLGFASAPAAGAFSYVIMSRL